MKPTLAIVVEGGVVQGTYWIGSVPPPDMRVLLVDYDDEESGQYIGPMPVERITEMNRLLAEVLAFTAKYEGGPK